MRYVSTRGSAPELGFVDTLLAGLASDGGLYVPAKWPELPPIEPGAGYAASAAAVMAPYVGDEVARATLEEICANAYAVPDPFGHPAVCPLVQLGPDDWLLELFHGPTLSFKDLALQVVGRLFDHVLAQRGERVTIVTATSGDTGSAAVDAVAGRSNIDIVILYPEGRISDVQRRQMTTVATDNVQTVAVDGTFDDCQDLVKAMFGDAAFRDEHRLSAVNSINWARVMAQVVYYATTTASFGGRPVSFAVPTGNFGNVLAGWISMRTGAPIHRLLIGSNCNDILTRFLATRIMATADVVPTLSPSMDIQVSSNFERLLFEVNGRDGGMTAEQLRQLRATGHLAVETDQYEEWLAPVFRAVRFDDPATLAVMREVYDETGLLVDPHTAIGIGAARSAREPGVATVALGTAHPAKFPDAVEQATGIRPSLPPRLADLYELPERTSRVANDLAAVQAVVARHRARR
jgi:threonine synthase